MGRARARSIGTTEGALAALLLTVLMACAADPDSGGDAVAASRAESKRTCTDRTCRIESSPLTPPALHHGFTLAADEVLVFTVEQQGVDVAVRVVGPDGAVLLEVDSPNGAYGFESGTVLAGDAGAHQLEIAGRFEGTYGLTAAVLPASESLRTRAAAAQRLAHGRALASGFDVDVDAEAGLVAVEEALALLANFPEDTEAVVAPDADGSLLVVSELDGWHERMSAALRATRVAWNLLKNQKERGDVDLTRAARVRAVAHAETLLTWARGRPDALEMTRALSLLGNLVDDAESASSAFREALEVSPGTDRALEVLIGNDLGVALRRAGDLSGAISTLERSIALANALGDHEGEAQSRANAAYAYSLLDATGQAAAVLEPAKELDEVSDEKRANLEQRWGDLARARGDLEGAIARYQGALDSGALIGLSTASVEHALGLVLADRGGPADVDRARDLLRSARAAFENAGRIADVAFIDVTHAQLARYVDRPSDARKLLRASLMTFDADDHRAGQTAALVELAALTLQEDRPASARRHFERALHCTEAQRSEADSRWEQAGVLRRRRGAYDDYVDLLLDAARASNSQTALARAFEVDDLRRARDLTSRLGSSVTGTMVEGATPETLAESCRRGTSAARLENEGSPPAKDPPGERYRLVDVESVRAKLDANTSLLIYSIRGDRATLFWLDATRFEALDLGAARPIEASARQAHGWLSRPAGNLRVTSTLASLREALLDPIKDRLVGQRLVVVADGALRLLPFAALPAPNGAPDERLVDRHEIVYVPSAALLSRRLATAPRDLNVSLQAATADDSPSDGALSIAVFADAVYNGDDPRLPRDLTTAARVDAMPRLVASRREAEDIAARFGAQADLHLGFDAVPDRVRAGAITDVGIAHFAVHGDLSPIVPRLPRLLFSRFDAEGRTLEQPDLAIDEIYGLRLRTELVVLSACRSAEVHDFEEGVTSLAHAFLHAGARRLVGSLWKVEDDATARFMQRFYDALIAARRPPAAALGDAQRALRDAGAPLADWAAFVLEGDWQPLG